LKFITGYDLKTIENMKIKLMSKWTKWLMPNVDAITLAPFGIYICKGLIKDEITINHEKIHWHQQFEMLFIFFYLWYGIEYLIRVYKYGFREAYYHISFEREAYTFERYESYPDNRGHFGWIFYL
jgi:hypothetical protein